MIQPHMLIDASASNECKEIVVELILVGDHQPVRRTGIDFQYGLLDQLRRQQRQICDRNDLVVIAVKNQRWNVDLLEILGEIGFRKRLDAFIGTLKPTCIDQSQNASLMPCDTFDPGRFAP